MSMKSAADLSFVRTEMLPEQTPPVTEIGAIKWMRENLFSGWLNSILTVLSLAFVYFAISHVGLWFTRAIWNAGSLAECREILATAYGEGAHGACFGVIRDRWHQLLFGFYPSELYWRPVLTTVLMIAALAPVLFTGLPRKLMWFSLIYPGLAVWLLWGGSIWAPVAVYAGFVAGAFAFLVARPISALLAPAAGVLATLIWWGVLAGPAVGLLSSAIPIALRPVASDEFGGFLLSLVIGVSGVSL